MGWIMLISTPVTTHVGSASPMFIAQFPVPVPISSTRASDSKTGAQYKSESRTSLISWSKSSKCSCSCSSFGNKDSSRVSLSENVHRTGGDVPFLPCTAYRRPYSSEYRITSDVTVVVLSSSLSRLVGLLDCFCRAV